MQVENRDPLPSISITGHFPDREYTYEDALKAAREVDGFENRIHEWLNRFYRNRTGVDPKARVTIERFEGMPSLKITSVITPEFSGLPIAEQKRFSKLVQIEWMDFTKFLEQMFLNESI